MKDDDETTPPDNLITGVFWEITARCKVEILEKFLREMEEDNGKEK